MAAPPARYMEIGFAAVAFTARASCAASLRKASTYAGSARFLIVSWGMGSAFTVYHRKQARELRPMFLPPRFVACERALAWIQSFRESEVCMPVKTGVARQQNSESRQKRSIAVFPPQRRIGGHMRAQIDEPFFLIAIHGHAFEAGAAKIERDIGGHQQARKWIAAFKSHQYTIACVTPLHNAERAEAFEFALHR